MTTRHPEVPITDDQEREVFEQVKTAIDQLSPGERSRLETLQRRVREIMNNGGPRTARQHQLVVEFRERVIAL
jgi:hypothetical protein